MDGTDGMEYDTRRVATVGGTGMKVIEGRLYQQRARLVWQLRDIMINARAFAHCCLW